VSIISCTPLSRRHQRCSWLRCLLRGFSRCLPCELFADGLAGFFSNLARQPTPSSTANQRDIAAPLAADCQQATQRVQACKETLALAGGRVAYSIPQSHESPHTAQRTLPLPVPASKSKHLIILCFITLYHILNDPFAAYVPTKPDTETLTFDHQRGGILLHKNSDFGTTPF